MKMGRIVRIVLIVLSILGIFGSIFYVVFFENNFKNNIDYKILRYPDFAPIVGVLSLVIFCFVTSFGKKKK